MSNADRVQAEARDAAQAELASLLWREREMLEQLLFALTSQQLILSAGGVRWLTHADEQVQAAVRALTDCELQRALTTNELAARLELSPDVSLDEIVTAADEPWDALLADHRDVLRTLAAEVSAATAENRRLLQAGADLARDTLDQAGSISIGGYPGSPSTGRPAGPLLLDRQA